MHINYFDDKKLSGKGLQKTVDGILTYRKKVSKIVKNNDQRFPESALAQANDEMMLAEVYGAAKNFGKIKHLILVGIGGSSLGVEAIHSVCSEQVKSELHILDTVAAHELEAVWKRISAVKNVKDIAVCVISKSGNTTETQANAEIILGLLTEKFGNAIFKQTVFIGNKKSPLQTWAKKQKIATLEIPDKVGGRFSVFTPVGLLPLLLLGHNIDRLLEGLNESNSEQYEDVAATGAARLATYAKRGFVNYSVFVFDTRLVRLAKWYRQLLAESIGKDLNNKKKKNKFVFLPSVATAVELHSIGQLFFSATMPIYTDFISFEDEEIDYEIPKKPLLAKKLKGKSLQEIATAIYGGVVVAYQERKLPYRSTIFADDKIYSLGLFMGIRLREMMYLAEFLQVNAFDQPNVELYKEKTREILY